MRSKEKRCAQHPPLQSKIIIFCTQFSVLWLNPLSPDTFPPDILEVLELHSVDLSMLSKETVLSLRDRLRRQMEQERLQPLGEDDDGSLGPLKTSPASESHSISSDLIEEVIQFLRLGVQFHF